MMLLAGQGWRAIGTSWRAVPVAAAALLVIGCDQSSKTGDISADKAATSPELQSSGPASRAADANAAARSAGPVAPLAPHERTAQAILDRTIQAYQQARSYRDKGRLLKSQDGMQQGYECQVEFQRPNLMRVQFQVPISATETRDVLVVADGKRVYFKPSGFDNQVIVSAMPQVHELAEFALEGGEKFHCFPLGMLVDKAPLGETDRAKAKLLEPARIDGQPHERVELPTEAGPMTLWINPQTLVIRRVQLPTQGVPNLEMLCEFEDATLDLNIDASKFTWPVDKQEHFVREVVPPPHSFEAPSHLLGQPLPELQFLTSNGEQKDSKSLTGTVTVIDFWSSVQKDSLGKFPELDAVRKKFAGNDKVRFLAMSIDGPKTTNAEIAEKLKQANVDLPWARLVNDEFFTDHVGAVPAMLILAPDGTVQALEADMPLSILPEKIEAILSGKDLSKEAAIAWEKRQQEYQRQLKQSEIDPQAEIVEKARVAEATQPQNFNLALLWSAEEVKQPGNILVLPSAAADAAPANAAVQNDSRIYVIEYPNSVTQLDGTGKVVARHQDVVGGQSTVDRMRTAVTKDGKRIIVLVGVMREKFHVFDDKWQRLLSYPPEGKAQVVDVQPADLDGDGQLELCIGYSGLAGVQAVTMEGKRLWSDRTLKDVIDLAVSAADTAGKRRLLVTGDKGSLVPINSDGTLEVSLAVEGQIITHVAAADLDGDGKDEYCTLAINTADNTRHVVGLTLGESTGKFTWQHPLPAGEHASLVEAITSGSLEAGKPQCWLVACADGSIHIFAADGTPVDHFNTGDILTGLATATIGGKPALLIAHPDKLVALRIEKK